METIVEYAQTLVYRLLCLMPSRYQKASFSALLGLFLEAQGHPLPHHTQIKSASSLSRFLNHYNWSTRRVIRITRQTLLQHVAHHLPHPTVPLRVVIDLTSLEKCGKFLQLSTPTEVADTPDPWVRMLNDKRGLHVVVLYLVIGEWRVPWSFRVWRGKGYASPVHLACKLLAIVPTQLSRGRVVIVQADTEFGTVEFLQAVHQRSWRAVVGMRCNRKMSDGRSLQQLYRHGQRGQQVQLEGINHPLTVSWFWLKRAEGKRELRFVVSTHPYSGVYLVQLGRKRWVVEGFFKTIKHRFGWHRFGQSTKLGVYRWLILSLIAYLLAHWVSRLSPSWWSLDWGQVSTKALAILLPQVVWLKLLRQIQKSRSIIDELGVEIIVKPLPLAY